MSITLVSALRRGRVHLLTPHGLARSMIFVLANIKAAPQHTLRPCRLVRVQKRRLWTFGTHEAGLSRPLRFLS